MAETKETKKIEIEEKVVPQTRENYLVIGMSLGMSLGVAVGAMIGAAVEQIAVGMCFGVGTIGRASCRERVCQYV